MKHIFKTSIFALSTLVLAGCSTPNNAHYQPLSFDGENQYYIKAQSLNVIKETQQNNLPNLPFALQDTINNWISYKLITKGDTGIATVMLKEATLEFIPAEDKGNFFNPKPSGKITARIIMNVTVANNAQSSVDITVRGHRETPYEMTIQERDKIAYELMEQVIRKMDIEFQSAVKQRPAIFMVQ